MKTATTPSSRSFLKQVARLLSTRGQKQLRTMVTLSVICGIIRGLALVAFLPGAASLVSSKNTWGLGFTRWLIVLAALAVTSAILEYFLAMANYQVALDVMESVHDKVGKQVARLPLGYFKPQSAGDFSRLVSKQMLTLGESFAHMYSPMIMHSFTMLVLLAGTWVWAPMMGLILTASIPVVALAAYLARRCEDHTNKLTGPSTTEVSSRLVEFTQNQAILRACGKAQHFTPLQEAIDDSEKNGVKGLWWGLLGQFINGTVMQTVAVTAMVLSVSLSAGFKDPVATIVFIGIMLRFTTMLGEIGQLGMGIEKSQPLLARVNALLDEPTIKDPEHPQKANNRGAVAMQGVNFSYTQGKPVLRDVTFELPPRSFTAIVGPSGSGKTTIARLIARFYPVDSGEVKVGGIRVEDQNLADLMNQLAWVFQDVYLYDDTLKANILVGNPKASEEELQTAARLAGVEEIVNRLPNGWETHVGEGGRALSGGERQRVSIARAILKDAPIVLFDEATSALDPANEKHVVQTLEYLRERSTLVVIAHKLSTIESADTIVVLNDQGQISQQGTHEELLKQGGTYQEFWQLRQAAQGWSLT